MPQLPSGRHIGVGVGTLSELLNDADNGSRLEELYGIVDVIDLYPYIDVMFFRDPDGSEINNTVLAKNSRNPGNLIAYKSGFNFETIESQYNSWDVDDVDAFHNFIESPQMEDFIGSQLTNVIDLQDRIRNYAKIFADDEGADILNLLEDDGRHAPHQSGVSSLIEWNTLMAKVMMLSQHGDYDRAIVTAEKALKLAEEISGPDHFDVAAVLEKLAVIYHKTGREAKANGLERRVAEIKLNEA